MLGEKHNLEHEFPHHVERIALLKENNADFRTMAEEYHSLDKQIRVLELNSLPIEDISFTTLKKQRAYLKDCLHQMLEG
uniref:YdcH family protein n=1 Tax=Thaumasiovibrio occultus TaxID=1891184 RepID=UPI000B34BEEF|nr:DUF465 domain-containing protein [Thaumasiovibrio occultus]